MADADAAAAAAPPDDDTLLVALRELIQPDKLEELSMKSVMRALREKFGDGVRSRKPWISEQVTTIVQGLGDGDGGDGGGGAAPGPGGSSAAAAAASESDVSDAELSDDEPAAPLTDAELALQMQAQFNNEGLRRRAAPAKRAAPKRKRDDDSGAAGATKKRQTGYAAPMLVMEPLLSYLRKTGAMGDDATTIARSACQKHLTELMKAGGMKNPKDGREFLLDDELQAVFKRKKVTYFSIAKHLTPMLKRPEDVGAVAAPDSDSDSNGSDGSDGSDGSGSDDDDEDAVGLSSSDSDDEEAAAAPKPKKQKAAPKSAKAPAKKKQKGAAGAKAKAAQDGPKRATSAYFYYAADRRDWFKEEQPELKMTEVAKLIGAEWKGLSDDQKGKYNKLAAKDKARYEKEKGKMKGKGKGKAKAKKGKAADGGDKKPNTGGLNAPMVLSADLRAVCGGAAVLSRAQIVKQLWVYIKANELQRASNKQIIECDEAMQKVMGGEREIKGFSMSKYIGAHVTKPDAADDL